MSKKILSIVLALVLVLSMGTVALFTASADLADLPEQPADTYRYYFYMPDEWLNESTETTGNTAGIYWWEGTDACGGWPGYAANKADVEGVYYYDVPTDVTTIIWNNFFDGGADSSAPYYADAIQTRNIGTEYYDAGESDLYPEGTENFDGMIYVTDFNIYDKNDYSGKLQFGGEWFYYYGNGEYGTSQVKGESDVRTDYATNKDMPFPTDGPSSDDEIVTDPIVDPTTPTETIPTFDEIEPTEPTEPGNDVEPEKNACDTNITLNGETKSACIGDTITYTMEATVAELFENVQAIVTYDADKLELVRKGDDEVYEEEIACPDLGDAIFNADVAGEVKFNASKVKGYNFKDGGILITLDFVVKAEGDAAIATVIEEMTIKGDGTQSYFTGSQAVITEGITITETLAVPEHIFPTDPQPTEPQPTDPQPTEPQPTEPQPTEPQPTAPEKTDATSATDATETTPDGTVDTGATAYIYIALAIVAMAAAAVVVLRKRVNG